MALKRDTRVDNTVYVDVYMLAFFSSVLRISNSKLSSSTVTRTRRQC